jgi:hypothetical protein
MIKEILPPALEIHRIGAQMSYFQFPDSQIDITVDIHVPSLHLALEYQAIIYIQIGIH